MLTRHEPEQRKLRGHQAAPAAGARKSAPQEKTFAEEFYYRKQMQNRTPMVVHLVGGEQVRGWIEWYDRDCLKINREGAPNLLVMKRYVVFMYKAEEETPGASEA
jgi:sRNA-binding regulator protein Hfq